VSAPFFRVTFSKLPWVDITRASCPDRKVHFGPGPSTKATDVAAAAERPSRRARAVADAPLLVCSHWQGSLSRRWASVEDAGQPAGPRLSLTVTGRTFATLMAQFIQMTAAISGERSGGT
jgi:hypothetical protein